MRCFSAFCVLRDPSMKCVLLPQDWASLSLPSCHHALLQPHFVTFFCDVLHDPVKV